MKAIIIGAGQHAQVVNEMVSSGVYGQNVFSNIKDGMIKRGG